MWCWWEGVGVAVVFAGVEADEEEWVWTCPLFDGPEGDPVLAALVAMARADWVIWEEERDEDPPDEEDL